MAGTVHIIDDDVSMLTALTGSIRALGYTAYDYSSGKAFIEHGSSQQPQVILVDIQMPEMNGLELQSYLNSLPSPPIVILISGQSHPEHIIHGMKAGAVDFLIKPFSLEELDSAIKAALEKAISQNEKRSSDKELIAAYSALTPREQQVFCALGRGLLVKNIAFDFHVSVSVIKLHKSRVMRKLRLRNLQELARTYEKLGRPIAIPTTIKKSV